MLKRVLMLSLSLFAFMAAEVIGSVTEDVVSAEPFWYSAKVVIPQVHMSASPYEHGVLISESIDLPNLDLANGADSLELVFTDAVNLEASVTSEACDLRVEGNRVSVGLVDNQIARLNVKYWLNWPGESEPIVIYVGKDIPIVFAVISLRKANLRIETDGLKKETIESFEIYTGKDLSSELQATITIFPPKPWWGKFVIEIVLLGSIGLVISFFVLKPFVKIKQFNQHKNGMRNDG